MNKIFFCTGTVLHRELNSYEMYVSNEKPFYHVVHAEDEDEALKKLKLHYDALNDGYYNQYSIHDITVWESIQ